jgi:hypothetical protein
MHRERFAGDLLEAIGIDAEVRKQVLARAQEWQQRKRFGVKPPLIAELRRLLASSPYEGWARFHHHHIHVRLQGVDPAGRNARAFEALVDEDRRLEGELLARGGGGNAAVGGFALGAELSSQNLERSLDLRVLGDARRLADIRKLRFRTAGGAWETPEDPLEPLHHVVDAPRGTAFGTLSVEAELELADGSRRLLQRTVSLPRQPGFLRVRVEPSRLVGRARADRGEVELTLEFPPAYATLVTKVEMVVQRKTGAPERLALASPTWSVRVPDAKPAPIDLVEAVVTLSGRVRLVVPVMIAPPAAPPPPPPISSAR